MKRIYLFALLILAFVACKKEFKQEANKNNLDLKLIGEVQQFLKGKLSQATYDSIDFNRNIVYNIKNKACVVRLPFINQGDSTNFILVISKDRNSWEGNFVSIDKKNSESYLTTGTVTTISFDRKTTIVNAIGHKSSRSSRTLSLAVSINTGVPSSVWLSFVSFIQTQFPEAFNWYFQWDDDANNGGGSTGPGEPEPEPLLGATLYYDPEDGDEVLLDQKIIDSFPCVKQIIDSISQYANLNKQTQQALLDVFGIGKSVHLSIKVNYNWTKDSIDGDTKVDSAFTSYTPKGIEGLDFFATIRLNPWVLKHSTKEYIASTIIHEAYHAYINYKFSQYTRNLLNVDSNVIKTLFPIYWGIYGNGFTPGEITQHNIMASNLIQHMANPLSAFTNSALSPAMRDSIYRSLSWGGLHKTTAWRNKTDTCDIMAINMVARDTSLGQGHSFGAFNLGGCSTNYQLSYESLNLKMPCQ